MTQSPAYHEISTVMTEGFAIVPEVFTATELTALATELAAASLSRSRAGMRHILHHLSVASIASDSRLLKLGKEVLGPNAFPFRATLFDKSPAANWLVVWHQDTALPLRGKRDVSGWGPWSIKDGVTYAHAPASALQNVLAIRVHLDNSNEDNGPLRVLPNTHHRGVLSDDEIQRVSREIAPVACTVPRGGLVLMRPLIVHASSKAISAHSRRVLHIEYASQRCFDGLELATA
jgi:ectoine hydroxylase-related dioxygenase (phytanoyl-CoA dioxygenase family)